MSDSPESSKSTELGPQFRALLERGEVGAAAEVVIRELGPELLGYLHAVAPSPDEADEVFSIYCERLLGGLAKFRGDSTVRTWSYRVIRNLLIGGWRARQRNRVRSPQTGELSRVAAQVRSRTASYLRTKAKDRLSAIREQLSEEDSTLLVLRVDRQLPWKEIAAIMLDDPDRAAVARLRKRFERLVVRLRDQMRA